MNPTQPARAFREDRPRERRLLAFATSLILAGALILAPSSTWFAQAADPALTVPPWRLTGNKGTNPSTNFLGTTDNNALVLRTNNVEALRVLPGGNVGIGTPSPAFPLDVKGDVNTSARYDIGGTTVLQTPGTQNTFVGQAAGNASTTGISNTATGEYALESNTTGSGNTASGELTLPFNTTGSFNTAGGSEALYFNTTGSSNTATGEYALRSNIAGNGNTAIGVQALYFNTGDFNTATGVVALLANTTGSANTASGQQALESNTTGDDNTATGVSALASNTAGTLNTATGGSALGSNTTGNNNTAVGFGAGLSYYSSNANITGSNNTFLGFNTGPGTPTQLTNATAIGANATVSASNAVVLGGTGANAVNVGIGTSTPQSTLQVAGNGTGYGTYLQIPIVSSASGPPAGDCNGATLAGRMVLQDNAGAITLWVCSVSSGTWVAK